MAFEEKSPCVDCETRKWYSETLDIHFAGDDCYYICEVYDKYKAKRKAYLEEEEKRRKHENAAV